MENLDLTDVVKRVKAGDAVAFERIFNLYQQNIYNFLLYKLKDSAAAEDHLQEVFFKLWKNRANLQEEQSIKNYLYTIADNLVLNNARHLKVVTRYQEQFKAGLFYPAENPQQVLEEKEFKQRLMDAIEDLPEKSRIVFLLSRMEDLSYQEIAERLSISIKTVEGHMTKALKLLRERVYKKL
jgi:RNA polymerase sigma-70 factor (ECF subfamily)